MDLDEGSRSFQFLGLSPSELELKKWESRTIDATFSIMKPVFTSKAYSRRLAPLLAVAWMAFFSDFVLESQADTLVWGTGVGQANWTDTTAPYSQAFTVNGVTVTVSITGNTNRFTGAGPGGTAPNDSTALVPASPGGSGLYLAADYANTTESLTVTISYSSMITNLSFTIYDVDKSSSGSPFEDQIRTISSTDGASTFFATVSGSANNTATNSGTATAAITGNSVNTDGQAGGNANISFGSNEVNSVSFTWGSGPGAPANPFQQWISIGSLNYTVVPEPSTYIGGVLLLGLIAAHALRNWRMRKSYNLQSV